MAFVNYEQQQNKSLEDLNIKMSVVITSQKNYKHKQTPM